MACSLSESNGRIHSSLYLNYINSKKIHNFFIGGNPDNPNVQYIKFSYKNAFKSKICKSKKPKIVCFFGTNLIHCRCKKTSPIFKTPLMYLLRNYCYSNNLVLLNQLNSYVQENNIGTIVLWGGNTPFLYEYALELSKGNNLKLAIHTGEDYPLKNYNFISKTPSLFFKIYQSKLRYSAMNAYTYSSLNVYANRELLEAYENNFGVSNNHVIYFSSEFNEDKKPRFPVKRIIYAGNLRVDRFNSIAIISEHILKREDIGIEIYGNLSKSLLKRTKKYKNISYKGFLPYSELSKKLKEADLLLHVEGFSKKYIKDCAFAFSTKISDYYMLNIPVFVFGPKEISGVKFAYMLNKDFTATSSNELSKLDDFLDGNVKYDIDFNKIKKLFDCSFNSDRMLDLIEEE